MNKQEHDAVRDHIMKQLGQDRWSSWATRPIANKASFGDIDLVVATDEVWTPGIDFEERWSPIKNWCTDHAIEAISINSSVLSFAFPLASLPTPAQGHVQIDLIGHRAEEIACAVDFYSHGDLGVLLGVLAKPCSMRYGAYGLWWSPEPTRIHDVLITRDTAIIDKIFGLNHAQRQEGFVDELHVCQFVTSSPYFNPAMVSMMAANAAGRERLRRRPLQNYFYQSSLSMKPGPLAHQASPQHAWERACALVPDLSDRLARHKEQLERALALKSEIAEKINGHLVAEWTGLSGSDVGRVLDVLSSQWGQTLEEQWEWLNHHDARAQAQMIANSLKKPSP